MKQGVGPFPSPAAKEQWSANTVAPLMAVMSGEITANGQGILGSPSIGGRVQEVYASVQACGRDDAQDLYLDFNVYINGTTCLSTSARVTANNGSASEHKTSETSQANSDSVEAVIATAREFVPGDVLTYAATLTRTATPTTEMANACIVVKIEPN